MRIRFSWTDIITIACSLVLVESIVNQRASSESTMIDLAPLIGSDLWSLVQPSTYVLTQSDSGRSKLDWVCHDTDALICPPGSRPRAIPACLSSRQAHANVGAVMSTGVVVVNMTSISAVTSCETPPRSTFQLIEAPKPRTLPASLAQTRRVVVS